MPLDYVFFCVFRAWAPLLLRLLCAVPATFMPHFGGEGYSGAGGGPVGHMAVCGGRVGVGVGCLWISTSHGYDCSMRGFGLVVVCFCATPKYVSLFLSHRSRTHVALPVSHICLRGVDGGHGAELSAHHLCAIFALVQTHAAFVLLSCPLSLS